MVPTTKFERKYADFQKAVNNLKKSMDIELSLFPDIEVKDTIMNGQIQKFECCVELCWKTIKDYLLQKHGIEALSPKQAAKELFNVAAVDESLYENLFNAVEDRNQLSHIYREQMFQKIYKNLPIHLATFQKIVEVMEE